MIAIRRSDERGSTKLSWLDSRHTFSFGDYYDPAHMKVSVLRVINDDWIAPSGGFGNHPHRDMEIITYVMEGELEHRDSTGNHAAIRAGEVQRMTAGTGIVHSEFNHSSAAPVHMLQIWILPDRNGLVPGYEQRPAGKIGGNGALRKIAARGGDGGALTIHQDATLWLAQLADSVKTGLDLAPDRTAYVHIAHGRVTINGNEMREGDGAEITGETKLEIAALEKSEALIFDLP